MRLLLVNHPIVSLANIQSLFFILYFIIALFHSCFIIIFISICKQTRSSSSSAIENHGSSYMILFSIETVYPRFLQFLFSVFNSILFIIIFFQDLPVFFLKKSNLARMAEAVITTVVGKLLDSLFSGTKKYIDCVRNSAENVDKLKTEAQKLKDLKDEIEERIDVAKGKGDTIFAGVQNWMKKVEADLREVEDFIKEEANAKKTCLNLKLCVNIGTIYHYSNKAVVKTRSLLTHREDGKTYESCVSIPTPAPRSVDLYQPKDLENIDTQKSTLGKILTAICDESIQMVGIYGLGGVGKSTLANEVAEKVKNRFANIVFITVSQTVNVKEIKEKAEVAAKQVINGEKVLIILDDIWKELELSDLGIPCGNDHMNCKILLTSRSKDVCEAMNVQSYICVNPLTDEEAWVLFKRVVGERVDTNVQLNKVARKLIEKCGGLPLIIQVVGKTLKNKDIGIWKMALDQLQNHANLDVLPDIRTAFMHLNMSYNMLESKVAKSCFLLCSMFKEDAIIELRKLAEYGMGLGIFEKRDSMNDAEKKVQIAVDILKSCFLLLPDEKKARMHDVVRDVALLIGNGEFFVQSGKDLPEWPPRNNTSESCTKISLMDNRICMLPDYELHFPHVDTFLVRNNPLSVVPDVFFRGMPNVKVLDMSFNDISSIPQSLKLLTKLVMLDLSFNRSLCEISLLGELRLLEILKLRCTAVGVIPDEIGQLTNLRVLDLSFNLSLEKYIVKPGVLSKLTWLEELYIEFHDNMEWVYNCLLEISNLKSLKTLHLKVRFPEMFPKDCCFEYLPRFVIAIGDVGQTPDVNDLINLDVKRCMIIEGVKIMALMPLKKLIQVSDVIRVESMEDMDNILPDLYEENFDDLKYIVLRDCENVSCLLVTRGRDGMLSERKSKDKFFSQLEFIDLVKLPRLKLLWDCPHEYISFRNLRICSIDGCSSLLTVFPVSVAEGLTNLEHLQIRNCDSLVDVISGGNELVTSAASEIEQTDDASETKLGMHYANIVFPRLEIIYLHSLPKLESFYSGNSTIKYPSLERIEVIRCPSIKLCSSLSMLFPVSVAEGLINLTTIHIEDCDSLVDVISGGNELVTSASEIEQTDDASETQLGMHYANIVFPRLATIRLYSLPKLESFYSGNSTIKYPSLEHIEVCDCPSMKRWAYGVDDMPKINFGRTRRCINDFVALHHQTREWIILGTHDLDD